MSGATERSRGSARVCRVGAAAVGLSATLLLAVTLGASLVAVPGTRAGLRETKLGAADAELGGNLTVAQVEAGVLFVCTNTTSVSKSVWSCGPPTTNQR